MIGEDEYNRLLRPKHNMEYEQRLIRSIQQAKEGCVIEKTMEEPETMADEQAAVYRKRVGRIHVLAHAG